MLYIIVFQQFIHRSNHPIADPLIWKASNGDNVDITKIHWGGGIPTTADSKLCAVIDNSEKGY